ncbi:unnamed protein product [Orchesella dallaii]|uniref:Uncharacterized protein n=1 Tax=Orchesella dallaii TaxID=48710 RepID=A0ABP1PWA1_9HEXA
MVNIFGNNNNDMSKFGIAIFKNNSEVKANGSNNEGYISFNTNLKLESYNSKFHLVHNTSADLNASKSDLKACNCTKLTLTGKGIKATLKNNTNATFTGDNCNWEAEYNSNATVKGNKSRVHLVQNSNTVIEGDRCDIVAKFNIGLTILGDGSKVNVTRSQNHELKMATPEPDGYLGKLLKRDEIMITNKLEVSLVNISVAGDADGDKSASSIFGIFNNSKESVKTEPVVGPPTAKFLVDYVKEAVIDQASYNLGIFSFEFTSQSPTSRTFDVRLHEFTLDPGSLSADLISSTEVFIKGKKNGKQQNLRLIGPTVKPVPGFARTMFTIETAEKDS